MGNNLPCRFPPNGHLAAWMLTRTIFRRRRCGKVGGLVFRSLDAITLLIPHCSSPLKPEEFQVLRAQYEKEGEYVGIQTKFNYAWVSFPFMATHALRPPSNFNRAWSNRTFDPSSKKVSVCFRRSSAMLPSGVGNVFIISLWETTSWGTMVRRGDTTKGCLSTSQRICKQRVYGSWSMTRLRRKAWWVSQSWVEWLWPRASWAVCCSRAHGDDKALFLPAFQPSGMPFDASKMPLILFFRRDDGHGMGWRFPEVFFPVPFFIHYSWVPTLAMVGVTLINVEFPPSFLPGTNRSNVMTDMKI